VTTEPSPHTVPEPSSTGRPPIEVPRFGIHEVVLYAPAISTDPFAAAPHARFRHEAGPELVVAGFFDGAGTYRLRFSPSETGRWTYAVDPGELALRGDLTGELHCLPSTRRGPIRPALPGHHFAFASGERAFVLGNTAYNLIACYRRSPEEARAFVDYYAQRNVNWCRFFLQQTSWDSHGHVVWPWGGTAEEPDFASFDLETFRAAEAVVELLAARSCIASVILLHPSDAVFHTRDKESLRALFRRYFRYAVARLGAYANVVWNVANEWERQLVLDAGDVEILGGALAQLDPYRRPIAVHHHARFEFPTRPWVAMASMQHRGLPHEINRVAIVNRYFGKPVLNEEYGYEGDNLAPPNDPVNVRRDHWALTMAGAYGTYGDKTKGPKIGAYFSSTLKDSVGATAPDTLRHIPVLMSRTRYWEMAPMNELLSGCLAEEVFCLARPGEEYLVYMTVGQDIGLDLSHVTTPVLRCEWWNPRSGEVGATFDRPRDDGQRRWGSRAVRAAVVFTPPDYVQDWVLRVTVPPADLERLTSR
jgi:hypothetical protein